MSDKQIKISFVVVDSDKAKKAIDELTSSLERLAKASAAAGGGGVTTERTVLGHGGGPHQNSAGTAKAGSTAVGKQIGILPKILGDTDSASIGRLITATTSGFSRVSSTVKTFVNSTSQDINKLNASIESLNKSMNSVRGAGGGVGGGHGGGIGPVAMTSGPGGGGGRHPLSVVGGSPQENVLAAPAKAAASGQNSGGGGGSRRMGILGALTPMVGEATGGLGSGLLSAVGRFTAPAAIIAAAGMAYNYGADTAQATRISQLDYSIMESGRDRAGAAGIANMYKGNARALMGGDVNLATAMRLADEDYGGQGQIKASTKAFVEMRQRQEGILNANKLKQTASEVKDSIGKTTANASIGSVSAQTEKSGSLWDWLTSGKQTAGNVYSGVPGLHQGATVLHTGRQEVAKADTAFFEDTGIAVTDMSQNEIKNKQIAKEANEFALKQQQELIEAQRARISVFRETAQQSIYNNALSDVAAQRSGFISFGNRVGEDGEITGDQQILREAALKKRGLTLGDIYSTRAGLARGAGMGYLDLKGLGDDGSMALAGYGGLNGIPGIIRAGGMMAGSTAGGVSAYNLAHSLIGGRNDKSGALDTTIGSELFQTLGQRGMGIVAGGGGGIGSFFEGAAGVVAAPGADVGEQAKNMALLQTGMAMQNRMSSGDLAPYYKHRNMLRAVATAGGYGLLSQQIAKTTDEEMISAARDGTMSDPLKALGFTQEMAKKNLQMRAGDTFSERLEVARKSNPAIAAKVDALLGTYGGDVSKMLDAEAKTPEERRKLISELGTVTNSGTTAEILAMQTWSANPVRTGKRIAASGPRGLRKDALEDQAKTEQTVGETPDENMRKDIKKVGERIGQQDTKREVASDAIPDISKNANAFAISLQTLVTAINKSLEKMGVAPPTKAEGRK